MLAERSFDHAAIEPIDDAADRGVGRRPFPVQPERLVEAVAVHLDKGVNAAIGVRSGRNRQYREQKHITLFVPLALSTSRIRYCIEKR